MTKKYLILTMVVLLVACQPANTGYEVKTHTCTDNTMRKGDKIIISCNGDDCFYDSSKISMYPVTFKEVGSEYN